MPRGRVWKCTKPPRLLEATCWLMVVGLFLLSTVDALPPVKKRSLARSLPLAPAGLGRGGAGGPDLTTTKPSPSSSPSQSPLRVFLYIPNIIGYVRILLAFACFGHAFSSWRSFLSFYIVSVGLDAIDGQVARALNQASQLGQVLDMITDRCSTATLLVILSHLDLHRRGHYTLLMVLDIASHWCHVVSIRGHHKSAASLQGRASLLNAYYACRPLFYYCCVGNEGFLLAQYVLAFVAGQGGGKMENFLLLRNFFLPAFCLKQVINVVQLWSACYSLAAAQGD